MKVWWRSSLWLMASALFAFAGSAAGWEPGMALGSLSEFELEGEAPPIEGKVTLIDFWASWCAPCKAAFPEMEKLYQKYKGDGFQILAVSVDRNARMMQRFLERRKPSFATARDAKERMAKSAGIEAMPSSFLVDRNGVARYRHEGWHGKRSVERLDEQIQALLNE